LAAVIDRRYRGVVTAGNRRDRTLPPATSLSGKREGHISGDVRGDQSLIATLG